MPDRYSAHREHLDGMYGRADVPDQCPYCGGDWAAGERVCTGDDAGIGGYEDWMYCGQCKAEIFFPVVHRPESSNIELSRERSESA